MTRIINILTLGIFLTLISCTQVNEKNSTNKETINFKEVKRAEIKNNPLPETNEKNELRELTNDQAKLLVDKWNNSKSKGPYKSGTQYWILITLKDGTKRTFRATGQIIKEDNDWCYDIGDEQYFKNLYANSNPITDEKKKTFELMQGLWFHDQDSLASLTINNYHWTFNYKGEQTSFDDNYSISLTDKLPEFVKENGESRISYFDK